MTLSSLVLVIVIVIIYELALPLRMISVVLNRKIDVRQTLRVETSMLSIYFKRLIINIFLLIYTLLILKGIVALLEDVYSRTLKLMTY